MSRLRFSVAALALAAATPLQAQSISNTIFLVDESGSMAGEQAFLRNFVLDLDPALAIAGINQRNYGLIGFGGPGSGPAGLRAFDINGSQLGSATDFASAAAGLVTTGSVEDGYAAIDFVLQTYMTTGNAPTLVLVTDEDRDNTNAALDFASILSDIRTAGANLVAMLNINITDDTGATAIATDGSNALVQDGVTFATLPFGSFTTGSGTTIADYADLVVATKGGCVADLNQLRSGGDAAAAFAAAFQTCVINASTAGPIRAILTLPIRDSSLTVAQNIRLQLRAVATAMSAAGTGGTFSTQGSSDVVQDMFGIAGLRGYALGTASTGSVDGGTDLSSRGLTLGLDYTSRQGMGTARFGAAFSLARSQADGNGSDLDSDARFAHLYSLYRTDTGWQMGADINIGSLDIDTARRLGGATVRGSTDAEYRSIGLELGKRFDLSTTNGVLMPYVGLQRERLSQDRYTESGGGVVPSFTQHATTARLGMRFEHSARFGKSMMHTTVDGAWNRITSQDLDVGTGTVAFDPGDLDRDRFELGIGLGFDVGTSGRFNVSFNGSKSESTRIGSISLGYQMTF